MEAGEVDQLVRRLVTLVNQVRRGVGLTTWYLPSSGPCCRFEGCCLLSSWVLKAASKMWSECRAAFDLVLFVLEAALYFTCR